MCTVVVVVVVVVDPLVLSPPLARLDLAPSRFSLQGLPGHRLQPRVNPTTLLFLLLTYFTSTTTINYLLALPVDFGITRAVAAGVD